MPSQPDHRLDASVRAAILRTVRESIDTGLGVRSESPPDARTLEGVLAAARATFVTLRIGDDLRGCCGTLEPTRPLLVDVWHNARASAFRDPRFPALTVAEWQATSVEVSVLTLPEPMPVPSEQALRERLVPGRDGLILQWRGRRATFLPKVWDHVRDVHEFLALLKQKAGLPVDFWRDDVELWRYETETVADDLETSLPPGFAGHPDAA